VGHARAFAITSWLEGHIYVAPKEQLFELVPQTCQNIMLRHSAQLESARTGCNYRLNMGNS